MDLTSAGLEPGRDAMRELIRAAAERVIEHLATLETQPASDTEGAADVARLVSEPMPETGQPYEPLLDLLFQRLLPKGCNTNSPGMFSYVNGGSLLHSAVADLITSATNPYVAYWGAAPGLAEMENTVVRWFADMLGLPASAGGVLLSGGSMANLSALVTARSAKLGDDFERGVIYASDQVHHSLQKAALLAGFRRHALRIVPSDSAFRMRLDTLAEYVSEDRRAGRKPFCVVGTAGTTNTGAVDDLQALAHFSRDQGLWFHVDAAYGGFFALTERGKTVLSGIEHADSVVLDPHKSLFIPFGTGCLLVRDLETLRRAHQLHSEYIGAVLELGEEAQIVNIADLSPEMSRGMRALRIWLPLKLLGADAFRKALDEKLDLARAASTRLSNMREFELVAAPQLSILAFRAGAAGSVAEDDRLNSRLLEGVNRKGRAHLSSTILDGKVTLRLCVLSFRTHQAAVSRCLEDLREVLSAELEKAHGLPE